VVALQQTNFIDHLKCPFFGSTGFFFRFTGFEDAEIRRQGTITKTKKIRNKERERERVRERERDRREIKKRKVIEKL
jgi:hypothetical protein